MNKQIPEKTKRSDGIYGLLNYKSSKFLKETDKHLYSTKCQTDNSDRSNSLKREATTQTRSN